MQDVPPAPSVVEALDVDVVIVVTPAPPPPPVVFVQEVSHVAAKVIAPAALASSAVEPSSTVVWKQCFPSLF